MSVKTRTKINIPDWAKRDTLFHVIFWLGLYLAFIMMESNPIRPFTIVKELVNVSFYMVIVYFNLYYLIPTYLRESTGINYAISLVLTAIVLTPIKTLVFYLLFSEQPGVQSFFYCKARYYIFPALILWFSIHNIPNNFRLAERKC